MTLHQADQNVDTISKNGEGAEIAVQAKSYPLHNLEIGTNRTCDCQHGHINCLSAKEWMKSQIGVWQFSYEGRDIRDKR